MRSTTRRTYIRSLSAFVLAPSDELKQINANQIHHILGPSPETNIGTESNVTTSETDNIKDPFNNPRAPVEIRTFRQCDAAYCPTSCCWPPPLYRNKRRNAPPPPPPPLMQYLWSEFTTLNGYKCVFNRFIIK